MNNPFYTGYDTPENTPPQSFSPPPPPPPPMPPLSRSIAGFVKQHSTVLLIAHLLLFAAAATVSVIYFMPVPNSLYHPPAVKSPNYTTAIGLIPLALSHILAVTAEHIISRSSENKQRLNRALVLFAVSRLMHIASWAFILLAREVYGVLSGNRVNPTISATNIAGFCIGALFVSGADIPLSVLALRAGNSISNNDTARGSASWGTLLSVTVIISFIVSSFFSLVFFFSTLSGDHALMIISPLYLIGMISFNVILSKLSGFSREMGVTVPLPPVQQFPGQQQPIQQQPGQQSIIPPSILPTSFAPPAVQLSKEQPAAAPPAVPGYDAPDTDICYKTGKTVSDSAGKLAAGHLILGAALTVIAVLLIIAPFTPTLQLPSMKAEGTVIVFCGISHFIMLSALQKIIKSKNSKEDMIKALNTYNIARLIHLIALAFLVIYPFIAVGITGGTGFFPLFIPFIVPVIQDTSLLSLALSAKKSIQKGLPVIRERSSAVFAMVTSVLVCLATAYFSMYFIYLVTAGISYLIICILGAGCAFAVILFCLGVINLSQAVLKQKG